MDKKMFSISDVDFIKSAILNAEGKSESEKSDLTARVSMILTKTYRRE